MTPPTHLLRSELSLEWAMSQEQCITMLNLTPLKRSPKHLVVKLPFQENTYDLILLFDARGGLQRINVELYMSRYFWNNYSIEEVETITTEYKAHYNYLINHYKSVLGNPDFSGVWGDSGYPESQTGWHVTYWNKDGERVQVELDHPDDEYPIIVRVSWYSA